MNSRKRYRIVKPVRFFIFILACVMLIVFAGYSLLSMSKAEASAPDTYVQVVIAENDTLWTIAESCNPGVNMDTRDIVHEICAVNDIKAGDIMPGDTISVPVYG